MTILGIVFIIIAAFAIMAIIGFFLDNDGKGALISLFVVSVFGWIGISLTAGHIQVDQSRAGVTVSRVSKQVSQTIPSGFHKKPWFAEEYTFPASADWRECDEFFPTTAGGYEVSATICVYYDLSQFNWSQEVQLTGWYDGYNDNLEIWSTLYVDGISRVFNATTPEGLTTGDRGKIGPALMTELLPVFEQRHLTVTHIVLYDWHFTSTAVSKAFDAVIVAQRAVQNTEYKLQLAEKERELELYRIDTDKLIAQEQLKMLKSLGLEGSDAVNYLWLLSLEDSEDKVDVTLVSGSMLGK